MFHDIARRQVNLCILLARKYRVAESSNIFYFEKKEGLTAAISKPSYTLLQIILKMWNITILINNNSIPKYYIKLSI